MHFISEKFKEKYPEHFGATDGNIDGRIFYQFQRIQAKRIQPVLNGKIYVSNPNNFNDPFDCWGNLENDIGPESEFNINFYEDKLNRGAKELGVICLTSAWDNQLMWSHYAESHKGISFGYEIKESTWKGGDDFVFRPVQYQILSPIPMSKAWSNQATYLPSDFAAASILNTKNPDWHYEREWRIMCRPCYRGKSVELNQIGMRLKEVIFGLDVPNSKLISISKNFIESGLNPELFKVVYDRKSLGLAKVEV